MPAASRLTDACIHPTMVTSGSPDTKIGGLKAARLGDTVTPCPLCKTPPGKIVQGSGTVFTNSIAQSRIGDGVACGAGGAPPGGGSHAPVSTYACQDSDNYLLAAFKDDNFLISEQSPPPAAIPIPDEAAERQAVTFLDAISLDIDVGSRTGGSAGGGGANKLAGGCPTVIVGG